MRRSLLWALIGVALLAGAAWGQSGCGCGYEATAEGVPECYTSFWSGDQVLFELVVPVDFFFACAGCPTPLVIGWRVETLDGFVLNEAGFASPKPHGFEMAWNGHDQWGNRIPAGFYRVVVVTDTAGEFATWIEIVERPCPVWPCWCACLTCCGDTPSSVPCCPPFGLPYVRITNEASQSQSFFRIQLTIVQTGSSTP